MEKKKKKEMKSQDINKSLQEFQKIKEKMMKRRYKVEHITDTKNYTF